MELVYLWVDNYNNLNKAGFNFYKNMQFKLNVNAELEYEKEKPTVDQNFFSKGISINAIVGENGTGKSSIMKILEEICFHPGLTNQKEIYNTSFILIFKKKTRFYMYKHNIDLNKIPYVLSFKDSIMKIDNLRHEFSLFTYFSEMPYQYKRANLDPYTKDNPTYKRGIYSPPSVMDKNWDLYYTVTFDKRRICNFIYKLNEEGLLSLIGKKIFQPIELEFISNSFFEEVPTFKGENRLILYQNYHNLTEKVYPNSDNKLEEIYERVLYNKLLYVYRKTSSNFVENEIVFPELIFNETEENIRKIETFFNDNNSKELLGYKFDYSYDELLSIVMDKRISINDLTNADLQLVEKYFEFFSLEYYDMKGRTFSSLSHGEKTSFSLSINILIKLGMSGAKNYILFFDEPDLSLHPKWQRELVFDLVSLSKKIIDKKKINNIQYIFTTHSPFLISDIPSENIIFLLKSGVSEFNEETFGNNIHSLLSNSFFLGTNLMGKFSEKKITEAFLWTNYYIDYIKKYSNELKETSSLLEYLYSLYKKKEIPVLMKRNIFKLYKMKNLDKEGFINEIYKTNNEFYNMQRDNFYKLIKLISVEYLSKILEEHLIEIDLFFNLNEEENRKKMLLSALNKNPELIHKFLDEIND